MNKQEAEIAIQDGRAFTVGKSFVFAVQIPDNSQGCSASRCSNCGGGVAYCNMLCRECKLPLIGPFGFPQFPEWQSMDQREQRALVDHIFMYGERRGRLQYVGVENVPLFPRDVARLELLSKYDAETYLHVHGVGTDFEFLCMF